MNRKLALIAAGVLAAGGLGIGLTAAFSGRSSPSGTSNPAPGASGYSYYRQVMGRYGLASGSMMGGSYGWMMGTAGYGWMLGGTAAPGWMTGASLPGFMTGAGTDASRIMGSLFADAPGPRIDAADATRLGDAVPAGAEVDRAADTLTFNSATVAFPVLASPSMPTEDFQITSLADPTVSVPAGARVTIELLNADGDMAHGLVVTTSGAASEPMPMMSAVPAFAGASVWFLGDSTSAGMHEATITFTASTAGTYQYLCPMPGHAQERMVGTFVVR